MPGTRGLAQRIRSGIMIMIAAFSLLIVAAEMTINSRIALLNDDVERMIEQANRIQDVEELFRITVSSYRGYVAYGRDDFWEEVKQNRSQFSRELSEFVRETGEDAAGRFDRLTRLWEEYAVLLDRGRELRERNDTAALNVLSQMQTTPLINQIGREFDDFELEQRQEIQAIIDDNKRLNRLLFAVPALVMAGALLVGIALVRYLRRTVVEPVQSIESAVQRIGHGEYVYLDEPKREDEVGRLQSGINRMIRELEVRDAELQSQMKQLGEQHDELEAQNEEILAQQQEQNETLDKLKERETELALINSYQEKLTGYVHMTDFLASAVPAMLQALGYDSAIVMKRAASAGDDYTPLYSVGYPEIRGEPSRTELYGPARRVVDERRPLARSRRLTGNERGIHREYEYARDEYFPLLNDQQAVVGFLLLTAYGYGRDERGGTLTEGIVKQFSLAFLAQMTNEERYRQASELERLNAELMAEKQLLQEQRDLVRHILESIHEGMLMCDEAGTVMFANSRMTRFFGDSPLVGVSIGALYERLRPASGAASVKLYDKIQAVLQGKADQLREHLSVELADSGVKHFELSLSALSGGDAAHRCLFVFRDRTEEEKADQMKNEFVSIVSHELRTPLSSVLGFIEILLHRELPPAKQKRYLETVHKEAQRLSSLINDFLDLQRMDAGRQSYRFLPVDLAALIGDVAEQWQGKQRHVLKVAVPEADCFIRADRDRMTQVLHNLISNAVKYSPQAERIDIRVHAESGHWLIEVQDYGLGIPEEARSKMFNKFYRVDNSDRRQIGGTGLGLAIVKEIVREHRGDIDFVSRLGQGSTFTVRLPALLPKPLGGKVLVVEDDENLSRLIGASLEQQQMETVHVDSSEEAIFHLRRGQGAPPLLYIIDLQLQGEQTGWDLVREIVGDPRCKDTPIIIASVLDQPDGYSEKSNEKYLQKPFAVDRLMELTRELLRREESRSRLVIPYQNEEAVAISLKRQGIPVAEWRVSGDAIVVDVDAVQDGGPPEEKSVAEDGAR